MNQIEGTSIFVFQMPPLPGSTGGLPVQMVIQSSQEHRVVFEAMEKIKQAAMASGLFAVVDSDLDYNSPVVQVRIDRAKAIIARSPEMPVSVCTWSVTAAVQPSRTG